MHPCFTGEGMRPPEVRRGCPGPGRRNPSTLLTSLSPAAVTGDAGEPGTASRHGPPDGLRRLLPGRLAPPVARVTELAAAQPRRHLIACSVSRFSHPKFQTPDSQRGLERQSTDAQKAERDLSPVPARVPGTSREAPGRRSGVSDAARVGMPGRHSRTWLVWGR